MIFKMLPPWWRTDYDIYKFLHNFAEVQVKMNQTSAWITLKYGAVLFYQGYRIIKMKN
jgi:hypothetical protein